MVVLATLKNMFPSYRLHFLSVADLSMFHMLHVMFPRNRHQSMDGAHSRATPFSVHQDKASAIWMEPIAEPPHSQSTRTRLLPFHTVNQALPSVVPIFTRRHSIDKISFLPITQADPVNIATIIILMATEVSSLTKVPEVENL